MKTTKFFLLFSLLAIGACDDDYYSKGMPFHIKGQVIDQYVVASSFMVSCQYPGNHIVVNTADDRLDIATETRTTVVGDSVEAYGTSWRIRGCAIRTVADTVFIRKKAK